MEDQKDKSARLKYLNEEKQKQEEKKYFYIQQIKKLKALFEFNEKEIKYNKGWVAFHEGAIEKHKEEIQKAITLEKKQEQENKLRFHVGEIENHHKKYIDYHKKEMELFIKKEIQLFNEGIRNCEQQLNFLSNKIKENIS